MSQRICEGASFKRPSTIYLFEQRLSSIPSHYKPDHNKEEQRDATCCRSSVIIWTAAGYFCLWITYQKNVAQARRNGFMEGNFSFLTHPYLCRFQSMQVHFKVTESFWERTRLIQCPPGLAYMVPILSTEVSLFKLESQLSVLHRQIQQTFAVPKVIINDDGVEFVQCKFEQVHSLYETHVYLDASTKLGMSWKSSTEEWLDEKVWSFLALSHLVLSSSLTWMGHTSQQEKCSLHSKTRGTDPYMCITFSHWRR